MSVPGTAISVCRIHRPSGRPVRRSRPRRRDHPSRARQWVEQAYVGLFPEMADSLLERYDVVSMHHYLEHTREPADELDAAAKVPARRFPVDRAARLGERLRAPAGLDVETLVPTPSTCWPEGTEWPGCDRGFASIELRHGAVLSTWRLSRCQRSKVAGWTKHGRRAGPAGGRGRTPGTGMKGPSRDVRRSRNLRRWPES
jgi:hypothetical protein